MVGRPLDKTKLCGSNWESICRACQLEDEECCRDLEMTLFPDELAPFGKRDPEGVVEYEDGTFGYEADRCCFLMEDNRCELQVLGYPKPVDCLMFPINYKNGRLYLDMSCWATDLSDLNEARSVLYAKLERFPHYHTVEYGVQETDVELEVIPPVEELVRRRREEEKREGRVEFGLLDA